MIVCLFSIWACYFFEMKPIFKNIPNHQKKIEWAKKNLGWDDVSVRSAETVKLPLATFATSFISMMATRSHGTNCFLMGEWSNASKSWWYYYIVAFGIKSTIPFLFLIGLSLLFIKRLDADRTAKICLTVPIAVFYLATMGDKAAAGIRYFLPTYPLMFILCGGFIAWSFKS